METTHSFRGRTMQEAVTRLKAALGGDAVIVGTRRGADHQGAFVEITATVEQTAASRAPPEAPAMGGARGAKAAYARVAGGRAADMRDSGPPAPRSRVEHLSRVSGAEEKPRGFAERAAWLAEQIATRRGEVDVRSAGAEARGARGSDGLSRGRADERLTARRQGADVEPDWAAAIAGLEASIAELRAIASSSEQGVGAGLAEALEEVGLSAAHARSVSEATRARGPAGGWDDGALWAAVGRSMADSLDCADERQSCFATPGRRVLAFVGPTGVGKTTTIAKLAAHAALIEGRSVALVSVDTFRMAAVEQLARYAEILECPIRVVKQPEDLPRTLDELDADIVFIDTTGRNPRAIDQVDALRRFFPAGWGGETVLTVAANTRERDLFATIDGFGHLDYDLVCVTKLDETQAIGAVYSATRRAARPLAWVTDGQRVPEDLEVAESPRLAARIAAAAAERPGVARAG